MWHRKLMALGRWCGCHQLPERSFFVAGKQMPVCARCFGAFCGCIAALATFWWIPAHPLVLLGLCIPMLLDWFIQYVDLLPSTNRRRYVTGLLCGYGLNRLHLWFLRECAAFFLRYISPDT